MERGWSRQPKLSKRQARSVYTYWQWARARAQADEDDSNQVVAYEMRRQGFPTMDDLAERYRVAKSTIQAVVAGKTYANGESVVEDPPTALDPVERAVLYRLLTGRTEADIAREYRLHPEALWAVTRRILQKLGAKTTAHAVAIAVAGMVFTDEEVRAATTRPRKDQEGEDEGPH